MPGRVHVTIEHLKRMAKVVVRLGVPWPEGERLFVYWNCFFDPIKPRKRNSEVVLGVSETFVDLNGAPK
jgi:hypothetical protein